jgi:glycosyltransferase involved in cell wall biosynthesis
MVKERFPEKTNYVPHAVPRDLYSPMSPDEARKFKLALLGPARADHFTVLYVSRNARRKMTSDVLVSWKMFINELKEKHGHARATLLMHADPLDPEGTNLLAVSDMLGIKDSVVFSKERIGFNEMRTLYNVCDTIVNRSANEGFGLPTLEAMMCGKPIVAIKTGGLTRQVVNHETGEEHGIALEPEVRTMVGNHMVPYIYEDFVSHKTVTDAFMKMYEMGDEARRALGGRAREYALKNYDMQKIVNDWDSTLEATIEKWNADRNSWRRVEL